LDWNLLETVPGLVCPGRPTLRKNSAPKVGTRLNCLWGCLEYLGSAGIPRSARNDTLERLQGWYVLPVPP
jgi:hypothetical protein